MLSENLALLSRNDRLRLAVLVAILVAVAVWASIELVQPGPPRRIVLASGPDSGVYHRFALRYIESLRREGIVVEERRTNGAVDNLALLLDPKSGVDVAFMQGGLAAAPAADDLVMLASLYYEPLWIFYRGSETLTQINQLEGKRMAIGAVGSGTRALAMQVLAANGKLSAGGDTRGNTEVVAIGGDDAIRALKAGEVDAAFFVAGAQTPLIQAALRDPAIRQMNFVRAAAYARIYPFITRLTLPPGTIDLALNVPETEVEMIGTKAMLVARDGFHPALVNLLIDAARELHGGQGYFEAAGEFPGTSPVDLHVSPDADQHKRFGRSFLNRYLPFWLATLVERTIIVLVPLVVILVPLLNYLPQVLRWRVRSRVYRWYGELALLERDVATRKDALPIEKWLQDLDRIKAAVEGLRPPPAFASEAYTLREHIALVRRSVLARAGTATD
ncbi:MAG: TAXI family TRAP transporter solute-binding subunit [Casimicrobiaceae bacterium]